MDLSNPEMEDEKQYAGQRIRDLLRELGITQTTLAKKCGVSPQYLNNIIRRQQRITEDFAISLLNVAGVNLNWLFTGKGPMFFEDTEEEEKHKDKNTTFSELLKSASVNIKKASEIVDSSDDMP